MSKVIKPWGWYEVKESYPSAQTKLLQVNAGEQISYQFHNHRHEVWVILSGTGEVVLNGEVSPVNPGDIIVIKEGVRHSIRAITELQFHETWVGDILSEDDIIRLIDKYGRDVIEDDVPRSDGSISY